MEQNQISGLPAGWTYEDTPTQETPLPMQQSASPELPAGWTYEDESAPTQEASYFNPEMPENETWGQTLTRIPAGIASSAAKGVGKTYDFLTGLEESISSSLLPEEERQKFHEDRSKIPHSALSEKNIEEQLNKVVPKKYREPKGPIEEGLHRIASDLPFVALGAITGGLGTIPFALTKSTTSAIAGQTAKELGTGPLIEGLASLVGGMGPDAYKRFKGGESILKLAEAERQATYGISNPIAERTLVDSANAKKGIQGLLKEAEGNASKLSSTAAKSVGDELGKVSNVLIGKKANLKELINQKQHLNSRIRDISKETGKVERQYLERAVGVLKETIEKAEKELPEFGKNYRRGESLTTIVNTVKETEESLKEALKDPVFKHSYARKIFGIPGWIWGKAAPKDIMHFLKEDKKNATKYIGKVIKSAVSGDEATLTRNLKAFDKVMGRHGEGKSINKMNYGAKEKP